VLTTALTKVLSLGWGGWTAPRAKDETGTMPPEIYEASGRYRKEYILVPGDSIEVSVWRVPEVSRSVTVRPDGYISLPTLSQIKASGKTFPELEQELTERFSVRLKDPSVTVIAVKLRENMVYVMGDVTSQRAVPLQQARTVMQAIAMAGGPIRSSSLEDVSLVRVGSDGVLRALPIDAGAESQVSPFLVMSTIQLEPDDVIFVPESARSEVLRFLDDFIGRPLQYINLIGNTAINYRILEDTF